MSVVSEETVTKQPGFAGIYVPTPAKVVAGASAGVASLVFGIISLMPQIAGMKATWAQYQRFSDFFVYGLALGAIGLLFSFLHRSERGSKSFFGITWLAILTSGVGLILSVITWYLVFDAMNR